MGVMPTIGGRQMPHQLRRSRVRLCRPLLGLIVAIAGFATAAVVGVG